MKIKKYKIRDYVDKTVNSKTGAITKKIRWQVLTYVNKKILFLLIVISALLGSLGMANISFFVNLQRIFFASYFIITVFLWVFFMLGIILLFLPVDDEDFESEEAAKNYLNNKED